MKDIPDAFGVLKATYAPGLAERLRDLTIADKKHKLTADDLWALADLRALTSLNLAVNRLTGPSEPFASVSAKLSQLVSLDLDFDDAGFMSHKLLAALPGKLAALQSLKLDTKVIGEQSQQEEQLVHAVSSLTSLHTLRAMLALPSAAAQQLKYLELGDVEGMPEFTMLASLPELKQLYVPQHTVRAPFTHPALEELEAGRLVVGEQWRGRTADACKVEFLILSDMNNDEDSISDDSLCNMPLLPLLGKLSCAAAPNAALPGGITSLERLNLRSDEFGDKAHEQEQLGNAVSALTNLRELNSNLALGSAVAQQCALAKLKKLQQLNIVYADTTGAEFKLLAELPGLESLVVGNHTVRDPFTHPGLTKLAAARRWRWASSGGARQQQSAAFRSWS